MPLLQLTSATTSSNCTPQKPNPPSSRFGANSSLLLGARVPMGRLTQTGELAPTTNKTDRRKPQTRCHTPAPLDINAQRDAIESLCRQKHEEWVTKHQQESRFDLHASRIRASGLVTEAWRLEKEHLEHQYAACKRLIARQQEAPVGSPRKTHCESTVATDCACLRAPIYRQLLPKYRVMNLLQGCVAPGKLESTVDDLRRSFSNDHEMVSAVVARHGPEGTDVDPVLWMRSIEERRATVDRKWQEIGRAVKREMRHGDTFPTVIRNLSIMRIFLEGSQAATYGCDVTERARRDEVHRAVLDQLDAARRLFLPTATSPRRAPRMASA